MRKITNISEAKANLSSLIQFVQKTNKPIIIGKAGRPVAILSAYNKNDEPRELGGSWEGKVKILGELDDDNESLVESFSNTPIFPGNQ